MHYPPFPPDMPVLLTGLILGTGYTGQECIAAVYPQVHEMNIIEVKRQRSSAWRLSTFDL